MRSTWVPERDEDVPTLEEFEAMVEAFRASIDRIFVDYCRAYELAWGVRYGTDPTYNTAIRNQDMRELCAEIEQYLRETLTVLRGIATRLHVALELWGDAT